MPITRNGVKWTELYDPAHTYREAWVEGAQIAERFAEVSWGERAQFVYDMVGWSKHVPGLILRQTPEPHPQMPWLYCMEAQSMETFGNHGQDELMGCYKADWMRYRLTYRTIDYNIREDGDDTADGFPEKSRFVRKRRKWGFENQQVPESKLVFTDGDYNGQEVPTVPAKTSVVMQYEFTLIRWPRDAVNLAEIDASAYKTNNAAMTICGETFATETLGFVGADQQDYVDAAGDQVCNLVLLFAKKPQGWNKFLNKKGAYNSVAYKNDTTVKQFAGYDLNGLFNPA